MDAISLSYIHFSNSVWCQSVIADGETYPTYNAIHQSGPIPTSASTWLSRFNKYSVRGERFDALKRLKRVA